MYNQRTCEIGKAEDKYDQNDVDQMEPKSPDQHQKPETKTNDFRPSTVTKSKYRQSRYMVAESLCPLTV